MPLDRNNVLKNYYLILLENINLIYIYILIFDGDVILRLKNYEIAVTDYEHPTKHCEPTQYIFQFIIIDVIYFI